MSLSYTTADLIASLRRRSLVPEAAAEGSLSASDLVALMSEELQTYIVAEMMKLREEFKVVDLDFTTTPGQTSYDIPSRAVGSKIKDIFAQEGSAYLQMARIEPEIGIVSSASGLPRAYYLKDNQIVFLSDPGSSVLKISYYRRPNKLIETADAGLITDIDTGTREVTIDNAPTSFTSSVAYDLIQATPHFNFRGVDLSASITGNVLTFADALPTGLAVGDYVCLAGESPVPQIPVELHPLLAQRTAVKALEALGDPKVSVAKSLCDEALSFAKTQLSPRVEEQARVVVNRYGPGWRRISWRR